MGRSGNDTGIRIGFQHFYLSKRQIEGVTKDRRTIKNEEGNDDESKGKNKRIEKSEKGSIYL